MPEERIEMLRDELESHLKMELLPFWLTRMKDNTNGGYITHFDKNGSDTQENEKSLIAQSRSLYTLSSAARQGYEIDKCINLARHGFDFLIRYLWDDLNGGFFWMVDRKGNIIRDDKVLYGQSFAIYGLSEYFLASGDKEALGYAEKLFTIISQKCYDQVYAGYYEMFDRMWNLAGPGSKGGDRKTLDVHMHLMEAFTNLYNGSKSKLHRETLKEVVQLLINKILHPKYKTGIPQFTPDWKVVTQIKFDIIWGWDRYTNGGQKSNPEDNTAYGHNAEFAWLLLHALKVLKEDPSDYLELIRTIYNHTFENGIDWKYGGVYVEGPHAGGVYDEEKEFWQQAEVMIGMLDAYILFKDLKYLNAYENIHRFVFDKMINHQIGEWWPLLTREGKPIWTHMSHSWKVNYHTVRCMIQCINRLDTIKNHLKK